MAKICPTREISYPPLTSRGSRMIASANLGVPDKLRLTPLWSQLLLRLQRESTTSLLGEDEHVLVWRRADTRRRVEALQLQQQRVLIELATAMGDEIAIERSHGFR